MPKPTAEPMAANINARLLENVARGVVFEWDTDLYLFFRKINIPPQLFITLYAYRNSCYRIVKLCSGKGGIVKKSKAKGKRKEEIYRKNKEVPSKIMQTDKGRLKNFSDGLDFVVGIQSCVWILY
ncbi:hypothetical protein [Neisseria sp.]|uniref:hypothetical protein n=1 Tax=Neisseria sp. TaxID=192066 RepID=UPI00359FFF7F